MPDNPSPMTPPLTSEEAAFSDALQGFFSSLLSLNQAREGLRAAGGDALRAFLSSIPEEDRADAAAQWPMLSLMLDSMSNVRA